MQEFFLTGRCKNLSIFKAQTEYFWLVSFLVDFLEGGKQASFPLQNGNSVKPLLCTSTRISAVSVLHGICQAGAVNALF